MPLSPQSKRCVRPDRGDGRRAAGGGAGVPRRLAGHHAELDHSELHGGDADRAAAGRAEPRYPHRPVGWPGRQEQLRQRYTGEATPPTPFPLSPLHLLFGMTPLTPTSPLPVHHFRHPDITLATSSRPSTHPDTITFTTTLLSTPETFHS